MDAGNSWQEIHGPINASFNTAHCRSQHTRHGFSNIDKIKIVELLCLKVSGGELESWVSPRGVFAFLARLFLATNQYIYFLKRVCDAMLRM